MKRLIVNADDYGLCPEVTQGILKAWDAGVISSTTVLANLCPGDDLRRLRDSGLACGLHVNLVEGPPLTGAVGFRAIVGADGCFSGVGKLAWAVFRKRLPPGRIREELNAQAGVLDDAGLRIDHLDGHRHAHHLPVVTEVAAQTALTVGVGGIRLSREPLGFELGAWRATVKKVMMLPFARAAARTYAEYGLGTAHGFFGVALLEARDPAERIRRALSRLNDGVTEMALHLASARTAGPDGGPFSAWARTLEALLSMGFAELLAAHGAVLTTFGEVWGTRRAERGPVPSGRSGVKEMGNM